LIILTDDTRRCAIDVVCSSICHAAAWWMMLQVVRLVSAAVAFITLHGEWQAGV
jgi:hypothetical protein